MGNRQSDEPVLIYATCPNVDVATAVGEPLVEAGLAACLNILPAMTAIYSWQGRLHKDNECVLIIKTRASLAERVITDARSRHPYDEPAFLVVPVLGGSASYIHWIMQETVQGAKSAAAQNDGE